MGWATRATAGAAALALIAGCDAATSSTGPASPSNKALTITVAPVGRASPRGLSRARQVVAARLRALHLGTATLVGNHILVTVATDKLGEAEQVVTEPGNLRFRQVLATHRNAGATATPKVNRAGSITPALLASLAHWDCTTNTNPTRGADAATDYILACNQKQTRVYLLAPASLDGSDVRAASAGLGPLDISPTTSPVASGAPTSVSSNDWVVNLGFTHVGSRKWLALTKQTFEVTNSPDSGYPSCAPPKGCNAIGITLDGVVESDPATEVDGIPGGQTVISGNFSQADADRLAAVLHAGRLPLTLHLAG